MINDEMMNYEKLWHLFMRTRRSASYEYYVVQKNGDHKDVPKCFPSLRHWVRTLPSHLNLKFKRPGKDECNACTFLPVMLADELDVEKKEKLRQAIEDHSLRWQFQYGWNTYLLMASILSFDIRSIKDEKACETNLRKSRKPSL